MNALTPQTSVTINPDAYIYDVLALSSGLATLSSDDALRLFRPENDGRVTELRRLETAQAGVMCLKALDAGRDVVCTAARDGTLAMWDLRAAAGKVGCVAVEGNAPVLALACASTSFGVAAGTELTRTQATIAIWDTRHLSTPRVQYVESHSDDITELQYHATRPEILLSGSADGLVNLYNTRLGSDEEEALRQTINHDASVHRANFLAPTDDIFVLSHDEKFSVYDSMLADPPAAVDDEVWVRPPSRHFGDVRGLLGCEYVVNVAVGRSDGSAVVGAGSHSNEQFSLVQLTKSGRGNWSFNPETRVMLPGAHGSDIVRSFCFLDSQRTIFTVGEDGRIKGWGADA